MYKTIQQKKVYSETMKTQENLKTQTVENGENIEPIKMENGKYQKLRKSIFCLVVFIAIPMLVNLMRLQTYSKSNQTSKVPTFAKNQSPDSLDSQELTQPQTKRRNLSVWTANCCPTTQKCGMFVEDCCKIDTRGCNWFFFCYEKADDQNCRRVRSIVKKLDGYWAI